MCLCCPELLQVSRKQIYPECQRAVFSNDVLWLPSLVTVLCLSSLVQRSCKALASCAPPLLPPLARWHQWAVTPLHAGGKSPLLSWPFQLGGVQHGQH
jgi:hypothetical protein